jgi:hypothetical protein
MRAKGDRSMTARTAQAMTAEGEPFTVADAWHASWQPAQPQAMPGRSEENDIAARVALAMCRRGLEARRAYPKPWTVPAYNPARVVIESPAEPPYGAEPE